MDTEGIEFHIAHNDYFGTLATVLDLMGQAFEKRGVKGEDVDLLRSLRDELLYLQENHTIR
jgi:hypothetical protein